MRPKKGAALNQEEFFDSIKNKKMKEAHITLECGCELLYAPLLAEVHGKPCDLHKSDM